MDYIENRTYDELAVGDEARVQRTLSHKDIRLFAAMSGDVNPVHLDEEFVRSSVFQEVIGHGMWGGSMISTVLGTQLPGPGTIYLSQTFKFLKPVKVGDRLDVCVRVLEKQDKSRVLFDCVCSNQDDEPVLTGEALVIAPTQKVKRRRADDPRAFVHEDGDRLKALVERARDGEPLRTGVVHPVKKVVLEGIAGAVEKNLIVPVLIGPRAKIEVAAAEAGFSLDGVEIVEAPHSHAAAETATALARKGAVGALMKGALHTDEIMGAVVNRQSGIRTERRLSHIYVMDTPAYKKLLFISDAAINIQPGLQDKCDITQNAIDLARALGVETPKTAILSAVETVYPKMQSTLDAASLCKMADRGQITGGVLDGPLAFDNAISEMAAAAKGISSPVAGDADILIVPDLEAGNMLAKELDYLAGAVAAGIVLGAQVPIILTSRAEGEAARVAASAVAKLFANREPKLR
ncbi:MAG: bifunctional enoyl-CoA hydratase/phosphate acetyltransferase [Pseudomonadota bacterium]